MRRANVDIPVRNKARAAVQRFIVADPLFELRFRNRDRPILQVAINLVDRELVGDEEVGNDYFVVSASRTAKRNINQLGSRLRKRIDRLLPAPFPPEKESAEETDPGEAEEPRVDLGR